MMKAERQQGPASGITVEGARYSLKLSPVLDTGLSKMAERMEMDKGKVIVHALTLLAICMEHRRLTGGEAALVDKDGAVVKAIALNDNGLAGDLDFAKANGE